jgi:hypothetical protein
MLAAGPVPFRWSSAALSAEDINLSIKRRCSIRILRFELLILKDAFLRLIFAFVFVVPRKHNKAVFRNRPGSHVWHHSQVDVVAGVVVVKEACWT